MNLRPAFSFRFKLLAAMMLVVTGVTGVTLYVARERMQATYERLFEQQFTSQIEFFSRLQEARLSQVKEKCLALSRSVRLAAAMEEGDFGLIYATARDELREVLPSGPPSRPRGRRPALRARLVRFLDPEGHEMFSREVAPLAVDPLQADDVMKAHFKQVADSLEDGDIQQVGYLARTVRGQRVFLEVVATKIVHRVTGEYLGGLVIGFPLLDRREKAMDKLGNIQSGIWLEDALYSETIPEALLDPLAGEVAARMESGTAQQGGFHYSIEDIPHRVMFQQMNRGSAFPTAYQISLHSLENALRDQRDLRNKIVAFGALVLLGALMLSVIISKGFSGPIHALVKGTHAVREGDFSIELPVRSRDEIGQLTESFNEMTAGLAQKEKFQNVLRMVADKDVAEELMTGSVALGGEVREISVLFCDIRGFTAMTQGMPPTEVIHLMNQHFTALTRVVYECHGVVDKFVGDLIMGVFGAPKSYGDDVANAAHCALRMIEERDKLNRETGQSITIGIGVASGEAVAGCMGSEDRLNYTVMGERVNLASRLCGVAERMETVIDETTYERLKHRAEVEPIDSLQVKGFSHPVQAYKLRKLSKPL